MLQLPFYTLFGWLVFAIRTFPSVTVEWVAVAVAAGAVVLLIAVAHPLACWLCTSGQSAAEPPRQWRFRWTLAGVLSILSIFAAGIAMIAIIHQAWWLASSREPIFASGGFRESARRIVSTNNLIQIGMGVRSYSAKHDCLPPGGTFNEYGEMQQSWETMLLPYLGEPGLYREIDQKLSWSDPRNAVFFKRILRVFLNPEVPREPNTEGYALSHYAVNCRVLGPNSHLRPEDVTDGLSNTIMAGEVNANFKPWGHPINWRDPAEGLNKSPDGFGGPWTTGITNMLMMDGSVRAIRNDIDPEVLKALATPAGGEKIPDDW